MKQEINIPGDVPKSNERLYKKNYLNATKNTGNLMLFAGDQKIEHLNEDFYGETDEGYKIAEDDADPEHFFKIASQATIGVFASQLGLIAKYGLDYKDINYLVKMNSKTNLIPKKQSDPLSQTIVDFEDVLELRKKLNIVGIGFTIYLGSEYEHIMLAEAGRLITLAHQHGMLGVLWMYPRGEAIKDEKDPHLIAGAAGVAVSLGADFAKVNYPHGKTEKARAESFKEVVKAAGRTKVIVSGGHATDVKKFLQQTYDQIHISGAQGNATGRNIHQKTLDEAIRMCNAISSITLGNKEVEFAYKVYKGEENFKL